MSKHKDVANNALDYLYQRIHNPLASDYERLRIARLAIDHLDRGEAVGHPLDGLTAPHFKAAVLKGDVSLDDALEYEQANLQRKTLIAWLEEQVNREEADYGQV